MKPTKKWHAGPDIPNMSKEELLEQIGGTESDAPEVESLEGEEGGGGSYGRPREQGDDGKPV